MNQKSLPLLWLILMPCLLMFGLLSCIDPSVFDAETAPTTSAAPPACRPLTGWPAWPQIDSYELAKNDTFIKDQIIVTGLRKDVATTLAAAGIPISLLDITAFDDLTIPQDILTTDVPTSPIDYPSLTIQLVSLIDSSFTITEAITAIYTTSADLYASKAISLPVFADFNAVTGDPNGVGAHPFGVSATASSFTEQWAFKDAPGIGLFFPYQKDGHVEDRHIGRLLSKEIVRVDIFDTSPFGISGTHEVPIPGTDESMQLCVSNLSSYQAISSSSVYTDVASHGLFAAGLVYGVAPATDIHLINVLDKRGQGDLHWLLKAMIMAMQARSKETIFNLSLGVEPAFAKLTLTQSAEISNVIGLLNYAALSLDKPSSPQNPACKILYTTPIVALETVVKIAHALGINIVAASGNDSTIPRPRPFGSPPDCETMAQYPAIYDPVIGVAASNSVEARACFANWGEITAPGGDAFDHEMPFWEMIRDAILGNLCKPRLLEQKCNSGTDCEYGLVSVIEKSSGGYTLAYWNGTSFATPLVSGVAALGVSQGFEKQDMKKLLPCLSSIQMVNGTSQLVNLKTGFKRWLGVPPETPDEEAITQYLDAYSRGALPSPECP